MNCWTECIDALQGSTAELLDNFACAKDKNIRIVVVKESMVNIPNKRSKKKCELAVTNDTDSDNTERELCIL